MSVVPILKEYIYQKFMRRFQTKEQLLQYQEKMVRRHLAFVLGESSFYRHHFQAETLEDIKDWKTLPTLDKKLMMENFNDLNTVGIDIDEAFKVAVQAENDRDFTPTIDGVTIGMSSGTSGNRGLFIVSPEERARWAGVVLAKLLPANILKTQRIAFFLRANSNLYTTTQSKTIQFAFFDLLDSLEEHIRKLNEYKPTILVAPPSMLRFLAESSSKGRLHISPVKILSVAEVLDPMDEAYIAKEFDQPIHQAYQCTEGFLGSTCEYGTLHMNEDLVFIQKEYLSDDKFMPIITDFSRKSQPIIRYRLNDILTEKKDLCPCGSPLMAIEQIEGRADDLFHFKKDGKLVPIFPDFFRNTIISSSAEIEEYRAVQLSQDLIEIEIRWKNNVEEEKVLDALDAFFKRQKIDVPHFRFKPYQFKPGGQKLRRIESRVVI